ncbi:MAG: squalene synthase HpnC [Gammaproteobacteria bacterium]|nr:MAG: squalene synthase HpnC [Gammaproteobacteria bacterium]
MTTSLSVNSAYRSCLQLANSHYENFPVASVLLPRHLRKPIAAIYAFARQADDFADEGHADNQTRLSALNHYNEMLERLLTGTQPDDVVFIALQDTIERYQLPASLFRDLLSAFSQDVVKKSYNDFSEVLDYCRRSANPVGRLLLHLAKQATPEHCAQSDAICTALQLINFLQDTTVDYKVGRIYLPQDELQEFGVSEGDIATRLYSEAWQKLITFQISRIRSMMLSGAPLATSLPGRLGWEIRATVLGGLQVLNKLEHCNQHSFLSRERLVTSDWVTIAAKIIPYTTE